MKKILSIVIIISMLSSLFFAPVVFADDETVVIDGITYTSHNTYCSVTACDSNKSGAVVIPEKVQFNNGLLTVTAVDPGAFMHRSDVTGISLPDTVNSVGMSAFYGCKSLLSIDLPAGMTEISENTFYNCENLKSVTIPDSVTVIGKKAFQYCRAIDSITVPDSVTTVNDGAFHYCSAAESLTIGKRVTSIANNAFRGCGALKKITVSKDNAAYHSAGDCLIDTNNKILMLGCQKSVIPDDGTVEVIGKYAFDKSVVTSMYIPEGVTTIEENAFYYCENLKSITIPSTVKTIKEGAFYSCRAIEKTYYLGTDWNSISISDYNTDLKPHLVYHSEHTYDDQYDYICNECGYRREHVWFLVTFVDRENVLSSVYYKIGDKVEVPDVKDYSDETYNYVFKGWDVKLQDVCEGDAEYNAVYDKIYIDYTVKFLDHDGKIISEKTYRYNDKITVPKDPKRDSDKTYTYTFKNWDKKIASTCTANAEYKAVYDSEYIEYTVKFVDADGKVISEKTYHYGDKIKAPEDPAQNDRSFIGWDKEVTDCTGSVTYTAKYAANVGKTILRGDCDGDGEINNRDVVELFRYVSSRDKKEDETVYDYNADGEVNNRDVVDLFRFVSTLH